MQLLIDIQLCESSPIAVYQRLIVERLHERLSEKDHAAFNPTNWEGGFFRGSIIRCYDLPLPNSEFEIALANLDHLQKHETCMLWAPGRLPMRKIIEDKVRRIVDNLPLTKQCSRSSN
jgi:hypothetical protein